uniref:Uncharacterized protein n=1 Tax=Oryza brachyantha TaxID=4533 RepID=J3N6W6_ORYBR
NGGSTSLERPSFICCNLSLLSFEASHACNANANLTSYVIYTFHLVSHAVSSFLGSVTMDDDHSGK